MESSDDVRSKLHDLLRCGICLDVYHEPKTLSCEHSFCALCLENIFLNNNGVLRCPTCRYLQEVSTKDKILSLRTSLHLRQTLEIFSHGNQSSSNGTAPSTTSYLSEKTEENREICIEQLPANNSPLSSCVCELPSTKIEKVDFSKKTKSNIQINSKCTYNSDLSEDFNKPRKLCCSDDEWTDVSSEVYSPTQNKLSNVKKSKKRRFLNGVMKLFASHHHVENDFAEMVVRDEQNKKEFKEEPALTTGLPVDSKNYKTHMPNSVLNPCKATNKYRKPDINTNNRLTHGNASRASSSSHTSKNNSSETNSYMGRSARTGHRAGAKPRHGGMTRQKKRTTEKPRTEKANKVGNGGGNSRVPRVGRGAMRGGRGMTAFLI